MTSGAAMRNCRMYEQQFPEIDEVIMVQVGAASILLPPPGSLPTLERPNLYCEAMPRNAGGEGQGKRRGTAASSIAGRREIAAFPPPLPPHSASAGTLVLWSL